MFSMGNPVKRQEIVPQMMIRNAAGLFSADNGAPLMTIPTKIEIKPMIRPITVDVSKTIPLLFAAKSGISRGANPCTQRTLQIIS